MPRSADLPLRGFKSLWRWVFVAVLVAAFWMALAPVGEGDDWFEHADKLRHALAFAGLWLIGRQARLSSGWALALGLMAFGVSIELAQGFTPDRQPSFGDLVADALGVLVAWWLLPMPVARKLKAPPAGPAG